MRWKATADGRERVLVPNFLQQQYSNFPQQQYLQEMASNHSFPQAIQAASTQQEAHAHDHEKAQAQAQRATCILVRGTCPVNLALAARLP